MGGVGLAMVTVSGRRGGALATLALRTAVLLVFEMALRLVSRLSQREAMELMPWRAADEEVERKVALLGRSL